jgi:DNA-binding GntR family transcriptional regulator
MTTLPTLWRTVLRAVEILRDEGLVFTVPRRGTYVSPDNR